MKRQLMTVLAMVAGMAVLTAVGETYEKGKVYNKPIVELGDGEIDGNGAIIDGGGTARCATLGPNVKLVNFTFRNGKAAVGGAVYGGSIENCTIENCTATEYGAAVANCKSVKNTTISGCKLPLSSSKAAIHGGIVADSTLDNVEISGCSVALGTSVPGFGGIAANSALKSCTVTGNNLVISGDHYGTIFYNCSVTGGQVTGNAGVNSSTVAAVMGGSVSGGCKLDDPEKPAPTPGPVPGPTPPTPVEPGVPVFTGWTGDVSGTVGTGFSAKIEAVAEGGSVKYKASGLPSGVKFNTKTGEFTGVPKTAKTYTVKVTATNAKSSRLKAVFTQTVTIAALPTWAVGTFTGGGDEGILTKMTVSKAGKFTGTWLEAGQTWKVSAASYDYVDPSFAQATLLFKCGKVSEQVVAAITADGVSSDVFVAKRVDWKSEPWKSLGKSLSKKTSKNPLTIVDGDGNALTVKISSSGSATVKATMAGGYKATAKSALCQGDAESLTATLFVYVAPKKNKFPEGYMAHFDLQFDMEGNVTVLP